MSFKDIYNSKSSIMSNHLTKYLQELEMKLLRVRKGLNSQVVKSADHNLEIELKKKIKQTRAMIEKKKNTFLIKTKEGYLTSNGQFTENVNLAYTYEEDEAVAKARQIDGWLEELPN